MNVKEQGYVKIYQNLVKWCYYRDIPVKNVYIHLILTAAQAPFQWEGKTIHTGQLITSYKALANDLGLTIRQIRTAIKKLCLAGEISIETSNRNSIITLNNFDQYVTI